jgi:hypothetical protein
MIMQNATFEIQRAAGSTDDLIRVVDEDGNVLFRVDYEGYCYGKNEVPITWLAVDHSGIV